MAPGEAIHSIRRCFKHDSMNRPEQIEDYDNVDQFLTVFEVSDEDNIDSWATKIGTGTHIIEEFLPAHTPCLGDFRNVKTCLHEFRFNSNPTEPCKPVIGQLQDCNREFYFDFNEKFPDHNCERLMRDFFMRTSYTTPAIKESKKAWKELYKCAKTFENEKIDQGKKNSGFLL